ncbi:MAG: hypothetical protein ACLPXM_12785 [Terriglobales bacterium]
MRIVSLYRREGSLYAVLQAQYRARNGSFIDEKLARAELSPFLHLPEEEALAAFVEYTVFKELRAEANVTLLKDAIRQGLRLTTTSERETLKEIDANGRMFHWGLLLQASSDIKPKRLLEHIRWGMGKNAVAQLFSGKQQMPVEEGYNEIGFFSPSYGLPASFFFYFEAGVLGGDKLRRIQIMYLTPAEQWPPDEEIERAYNLIKNDLVAQYGEPAITKDETDLPEEFRQSEMHVWKFSESILTLSYGLVRDGVPLNVCPPVTVAYGDRKHDPFSLPFAS